MRILLSRIMLSAAERMWRNAPTLGHYTAETAETEWNLAFHYAAELRTRLPWLDCDFDVTKNCRNYERPDIIFHLRGSHAFNFLIIEIKRLRNYAMVGADIRQIRERWMPPLLGYRFGASVILDEHAREAAVCALSQQEKRVNWLECADMPLLRHPRFPKEKIEYLRSLADEIAFNKDFDDGLGANEIETEVHNSFASVFGFTENARSRGKGQSKPKP